MKHNQNAKGMQVTEETLIVGVDIAVRFTSPGLDHREWRSESC